MKEISRVFLFGALALVLLLAGCAGEEGTSTAVGTFPPDVDLTGSPPAGGTDTVGTAETEAASPTTADTTAEATATQLATATGDTSQTQTPGIPVTGADIKILECQFCIDTMAFALLDIPATATVKIVDPASPDPDTQCNTVDTFNDRQVVLCRAPEETSVTLNVCTDANTCSQVSVNLQACPVAAGTAQPSATKTSGPGGAATGTPTTGASPTSTAGTGATSTPTP